MLSRIGGKGYPKACVESVVEPREEGNAQTTIPMDEDAEVSSTARSMVLCLGALHRRTVEYRCSI